MNLEKYLNESKRDFDYLIGKDLNNKQQDILDEIVNDINYLNKEIKKDLPRGKGTKEQTDIILLHIYDLYSNIQLAISDMKKLK